MSDAGPNWVIQEPRTSLLGGQTSQRHSFGVSPAVVLLLAVLAGVWVVGIVVTGSLIVIGVGLVVLVGLGAMFARVTDEGDGWTAVASNNLRYRLHHGVGGFGSACGVVVGVIAGVAVGAVTKSTAAGSLTAFGLALGLGFLLWSFPGPLGSRPLIAPTQLWEPRIVGRTPSAIGPLREFEVPASGGKIALLHHPKNGNFEKGYFSGVIEVIGNGDGLRRVSQVNTYGAQFGGITRALASAEIPVDQLDVETRVTPTEPEDYRRHVESLLVQDEDWWAVGERELLRSSMHELADVGAGAGETYRSFVTVNMRLEDLDKKAYRSDGSVTTIVESATETMRKTVEKFIGAEYEVRSVLTPRRLGALIRNTYVPSWSPDDLSGLETICDAFAFFGYDHGPEGRSLMVDADSHGVWYHAVASVPMDGWPTAAVGTRWLESLVTGTSTAVIRTVKAQHQLLSVREARKHAQSALTIDKAKLIGDDRRGKISDGVTEAQAASAERLLADLNAGGAGVRPALRVVVSARSALALEDARSVISGAAEDMKLQRLLWYDRRHDLGIVPLLPLGRGMRAIR